MIDVVGDVATSASATDASVPQYAAICCSMLQLYVQILERVSERLVPSVLREYGSDRVARGLKVAGGVCPGRVTFAQIVVRKTSTRSYVYVYVYLSAAADAQRSFSTRLHEADVAAYHLQLIPVYTLP